MSQSQKLAPYVFLTVNGYQSVVVTPNETHTPETWKKAQKQITDAYIAEYIYGEHRSPGGKCEGVKTVLGFFERHASEWNYTYIQGNTVPNWMLVE